MSAKDSIRHHIKRGTVPVRADMTVPKGRFSLRDRESDRVAGSGRLLERTLPALTDRVICLHPDDYADLGGV